MIIRMRNEIQIGEGKVVLNYCYIVFGLSILLSIHRLIFVLKYEASASKNAIKRMSACINDNSLKDITGGKE